MAQPRRAAKTWFLMISSRQIEGTSPPVPPLRSNRAAGCRSRKIHGNKGLAGRLHLERCACARSIIMGRHMKIAQIAPLVESVPPTLYGGTERVVAYLTEELVRQGHDVTLYASGDSRTSARLVPIVPQALRLDEKVRDYLPYTYLQIARVFRAADDFDVLHFHV